MSQVATRLCGCSFIHPQQTLAAGLDAVQRLGFSRVDIGVGGGNAHYIAAEVAQNPARYAEEVRRESDARDLIVNECFALNFGEPINTENAETRKRTRELFRGLCDFAAQAQFQSVMLIAGPTHNGRSREYSQELAAAALGELVEIAGEYELLLNLEADSESCVNTPEGARDLCERVPGLGLTLDHSHFICQDIAPARIEILYPHARHIHVRQSAPNRIVTPVNEGVVDFADAITKLNTCDYRGIFCIEYLSLSPDERTRKETEAQTVIMKNQMDSLFQENTPQDNTL